MSEQFEQDDREALLRAMAKRVHNREVGVFAGHDDFGTCASCEESVTAVLAAGFRRSPAPEQVSTVEELDALDHRAYVQGYDGFGHVKHLDHWVLIAGQGHAHDSDGIALPAVVLYRPEGGESDE